VAAVYDCLEQEQAFASPRMRSHVGALENELSRRVDVVFAISPEVRSERMQSNENTHVVRAGANIRHFQRGATKLAAPRALENVRRPILGYFGQLDPWKVDARLIRDVAMLRNDWSIVLVGHITRGFPIDLIEGLPNVQILGSRDYREIPSFLQNFDVCLMPFLVNEATLHGDHVKLYEYLASGKPVVSTDVPSARRFHELVLTSSSLETFIENVEAALLEGEDRWRTRVATARANSYHARVTDKIRALAPVLNGA
jgi:glycosyltransferase involved in cell wall biosynthesis